ncbi:MAG: ISL3 family transposase [Anaerolineales bacterium]|nr:ISL3 family transposase [Anaerolineales bacterium]MCB0026584.1 ISL3 family transposase [Anaerolineales bacterium]
MKSCAIPLPIPQLTDVQVIATDKTLEIHGTVQVKKARCPACACISRLVHGYYWRRLNDLPIYGREVTLVLRIQRRKCLNPDCIRRTFAIVPSQLFRPFQRYSQGLKDALYHVGQIAGGQAGARLASKLAMPVSGATLLRIIRKQPLSVGTQPEIIGIDDWAKRKGQSYGSIIVDHETHQVIDLLPDRSSDSVAAWLKTQPTVHTVTRDRSSEYARGIREGLPQATQVADRWHLLKNLVDATEKELAGLVPRLQKKLNNSVKPQRLRGRLSQTESEKQLSQARRAKRVKRYELVQFMKQKGLSQRRIAGLLKMGRGTVNKYYTADTFPEFKSTVKPSKLDRYLPYLEKRYQEGHGSAQRLWQEIVVQGYSQGPGQVVKWLS